MFVKYIFNFSYPIQITNCTMVAYTMVTYTIATSTMVTLP